MHLLHILWGKSTLQRFSVLADILFRNGLVVGILYNFVPKLFHQVPRRIGTEESAQQSDVNLGNTSEPEIDFGFLTQEGWCAVPDVLPEIDDEPMQYDDVKVGMWVVVGYDGKKYLGKVMKKEITKGDIPTEKYTVKCLSEPFPIPPHLNRSQLYENVEPTWYPKVWRTNAVVQQVQIDKKGKRSRKWYYTY